MARGTQKNPLVLAWSALSGPFVLLLPPSPATCVTFNTIYPNLKEKVPVCTSVAVEEGRGEEGRGEDGEETGRGGSGGSRN